MGTISSFGGFEVMFIPLGGIICIYLGYRLIKLGTSRTFDIFADLKGWKFRAANLAPGFFFAILGSVILCSSVIVNAISVLQKEKFINTYATKLILDELRKRNEETLSYKVEKNASVQKSASKFSPTADKTSSSKSINSNKVIVTSSGLRLRTRPGTQHQIVGSLHKGEVIKVKETKGPWLRVSTDKFIDGWVHGEYVDSIEGDASPDATERGMVISSHPLSLKR